MSTIIYLKLYDLINFSISFNENTFITVYFYFLDYNIIFICTNVKFNHCSVLSQKKKKKTIQGQKNSYFKQ